MGMICFCQLLYFLFCPVLDKVKKTFKYPCDSCHRKFNDEKNFNAHKKKEHGQQQQQSQTTLICPKCNHSTAIKEDIIKHFEDVHSISCNVETKKFSSFCEFESWKVEIEKHTHSSFVNAHGSHSTKKYVCSRSGVYKGKGNGLRHLKIQGSNKINGFCSAAVTVTKFNNNKCSVVYLNTHIGHENNLGHLFLTKQERETLSNKIAAKIPLLAILDEIRDSVTNCYSERLHLLTKKDLFNIKQCYKLKSVPQVNQDSSENGVNVEVPQNSDKGQTHNSSKFC